MTIPEDFREYMSGAASEGKTVKIQFKAEMYFSLEF
jgi:hypothetical protein